MIKLLLNLRVSRHQKRRFSAGPWLTIVSMQQLHWASSRKGGGTNGRCYKSLFYKCTLLLSAYFLTIQTYKRMCLITQVYGTSNQTVRKEQQPSLRSLRFVLYWYFVYCDSCYGQHCSCHTNQMGYITLIAQLAAPLDSIGLYCHKSLATRLY